MRKTTTRAKVIQLGGGEDLVTPPIEVNPGRALFAFNFDPGVLGGYDRVKGYERFDGRTSPNSVVGTIAVYFEDGLYEPDAGDILEGSVSGAYGTVDSVTVTAGAFATLDAVGYVTFSATDGTFVATDILQDKTYEDGFSSGFSSGFEI